MRIGYDVTVLYCAEGGIRRYTLALLAALAELCASGELDAELAMIDYVPVRGPLPLQCDVSGYLAPRVRLETVPYLRPCRFARSSKLRFRGGRRIGRLADSLLERPQQWWIDRRTDARRRQVLGHLDVLHASDVFHVPPGRTGLVATVFDLSPLHFPQHHRPENVELFRRKMDYLCAHAGRIIAISQHTARDLVGAYPAAAGRVDVVYCAAGPAFHAVTDPGLLSEVQKRYGIPAPGYILYVGTLEPRKNLVRLVEAYARVRAGHGTETPPLVLAGASGWGERPIFDAVERLNLQAHVLFTGYVAGADLPALYAGAGCFVYPSLFEGFGIPVLEAMACGTPVITSNTSSLPEVAGDAALLVAPEDTDALAAALSRLLGDASLQARLAALGSRQAARFSWQAAARQTFAAYQAARQWR